MCSYFLVQKSGLPRAHLRKNLKQNLAPRSKRNFVHDVLTSDELVGLRSTAQSGNPLDSRVRRERGSKETSQTSASPLLQILPRVV